MHLTAITDRPAAGGVGPKPSPRPSLRLFPLAWPCFLSLHIDRLVELIHETRAEVRLQLGDRAGAVRKEEGLLGA